MPRTTAEQLELVHDWTNRLLETASTLDDLGHPSLCTGWSRGHVLAHIQLNAVGMTNLVRAAHGADAAMYASSEDREADIDTGSHRGRAALTADIATTADELQSRLATLTPDLADVEVPRTPDAAVTFRAGRLVAMRLREVVYHHVDLDAGFTFADVEPDLVAEFLADEVERLAVSTPTVGFTLHTDDGDEFTVGDGSASVMGSRAGALLWLARQIPTGVHARPLPTLPRGH